ncbi:DUF7289 family protein [Natranaeroarchaeum sulfidigenes]|uniref:Putative pilin/flagellin n=1 Tax=Natranaeroarchaeum sulfidigenes TaxID=2784880 RepID=A0A897MS55_9EURY|nr:archaellin/type IV pilin N-terminal domain-containing protein [Natranaeroarchaeum sulfidigenes]QSG03394.1 putative pilin/flagellin [Natranaeroarchaeum sulfidigenes]
MRSVVPGDRGQSNVIGVALLLAITVIGIGGMAAGIGAVIDENADAADATTVADGFDDSLQPTSTTGHRTGDVRFTSGQVGVEPRQLRVLNETGPIETVPVDALVYESGETRVAYHSDAVVRGSPGNAWFRTEPPITIDQRSEGPVVISAAQLNASHIGIGGNSNRPVQLETDVSHERHNLGTDSYRIAVETSTPGPWKRYFEEIGATVETTDRKFAGDRETSVVATIDGERTAYLVTHDLRLEVSHG